MRIKEVKPSQRKRGRFLVKLEDDTILRLTEDAVLRFGLKAGMDLSSGQLEEIGADARRSAARAEAAGIAGSRAISRRELERKLEKKGVAAQEAQAAVDWLEDLGAIDDGDYARLVARHYAARNYGPGRVREELRRRGVPRELWEQALEELPDAAEAVAAYLGKKCPGGAPDERERRRLADGLLRRGFSWEDIRPALERLGSPAEEA